MAKKDENKFRAGCLVDESEEFTSEYEKLKEFIEYKFGRFADEEELATITDIVLRKEAHSQHVGVDYKRCETNPREQAFFDEWMKHNEPNHAVNYGHGILQDLFFKQKKLSMHYRDVECLEVITERDRKIVATVIQWLGTNCGMGFLHEALARFGYKIVKKD